MNKNIKVNVKVAKKEEKALPVKTEFIRLDSALKLCDAVQSGGHAKTVIQEGEVKVNGEVCTQRGKKLRDGDNFEFQRLLWVITAQK